MQRKSLTQPDSKKKAVSRPSLFAPCVQPLLKAESQQKSSVIAPKESKNRDISQLFYNSCAPFAIASLFALLLKENKQLDPEHILRIFEVSIYPQIWELPEGFANLEKTIQYLKQFGAEFAIVEDFTTLEPNPQEVLFAIGKKGLHVTLVTSNGTDFVEPWPTSKKIVWSEYIKEFSLITVIKLQIASCNVELIEKAYKKNLADIEMTLRLYYFNESWNSSIIHALTSLPLSPAFLTQLGSQIIRDPKEWIRSVGDMEAAIQLVPLTRESIFQYLTSLTELWYFYKNGIERIRALFPGREAELLNPIMTFPEKWIRRRNDIEIMLYGFPQSKDWLLKFITNHPQKWLADAVSIACMLELFPGNEEMIVRSLLSQPRACLERISQENQLDRVPNRIVSRILDALYSHNPAVRR